MTPRLTTRIGGALAAGVALLALAAAPVLADGRYQAKLQPLNAAKIGSHAKANANLEIKDGTLNVTIDASGLPPGMMHLQHFHGFPDGKQAACPTPAADTNGDGYIDLIETEPMAGTTMLPFHAHPATMEIPSDTYPKADASGVAHYRHAEAVAALEKGLQEKFNAPALALAKRVIFIHGVAQDAALPQSVQSLPGVPAQVTLPIACGVIEQSD